LNNGELSCLENDCSVVLEDNHKLRLNKDSRIVELIEEDKDGKEKLINYLFYTTDINDIVAYSGRPLEILISLNLNGVIDDLKLIKHSEPILLTGIPIEKLLEAICFYKGKNIKDRINIGENASGEVSVPIIAGATVTSLILHETILDSVREVAYGLNIIDELDSVVGGLKDNFKPYSWDDLLEIGAIKRYCLNSELSVVEKTDDDNLLVDIHFADLRHPSVGKNLLGESDYYNLMDDLNDDDSAIIILNDGYWSFKGSGFVRGGIFDRFRVEQGHNLFTFKDYNYKSIYDLDLVDVDDFRETGIFIISNSKFKSWKPWQLVFLLDYKSFYASYELPVSFCVQPESGWIKVWRAKIFYISLFLGLWFFVIFIFIIRSRLSKNNFYLSAVYNCILILDVYIIGILFEGQPSVVNLFALINDISQLSVFLFDPCIFLGWMMIMLTIFIWGKSLFCGWICPFGALQELIFKFRSLLFRNDVSIELSDVIMDKLRYLRYIIFIFLTVISFKSITLAERFSDIEPFKAVWIVGIGQSSSLIMLYTTLLLVCSVFTYRIFCRFICPLGAFLSLLSFITFFKLRRRGTCTICRICEKSCNSRAIDASGRIDSKECFGCFTCVNNMYNPDVCPPIRKMKVRNKYEKGIWFE